MAKKKRIRWEDHPSITLLNGTPRLKVFEEYSVEEDLPKFKKLLEEDAKNDKAVSSKNDTELVPFGSDELAAASGVVPRVSDLTAAKSAKWDRTRYVRLKAGIAIDSVNREKRKQGVWASLRKWASRLKPELPQHDGGVSVEETFRLVKEDELHLTTEDLLRSRAIAVALAKRFEETCQYGMAKKVTDHLELLSAKINLAQHDMCTYITEEQAIQFMTQAERGVQIEFLRYYPEVIPNDVAQKLAQCNLDMLFDNYVVMFYSKDAKPVRLLEEEIDEEERHRRRDPILFGTLRGSRDLYFVADWVYKDDDLTLSTVEKAIGTLPTLKDERISDSQYKIEEAMHDLWKMADLAVAESKDRGEFIPVPDQAVSQAGL